MNTKPEVLVRSALHKLGFRFKLHDKKLPGKPDIVLPKYKTVVFVHGCFWHQHSKCNDGHIPKTRTEYWIPKLNRNTNRDKLHHQKLTELGWQVITVWECEIQADFDRAVTIIATQLRRRLNE